MKRKRLPIPRAAARLAFVVAAALAVMLMATASASAAKPLTVCASGCQYTTIQAALNNAHDGDRITVGPGTYSGEFTIDKSVSLIGAGSDQTTIRDTTPAEQATSVVTISGDVSATISAVTIRDGVVFEPPFPFNHGGGGIYNLGTLRLTDSVVGANYTTEGGGGIENVGTMTLNRVTVSDNVSASGLGVGGAIYNLGSAVVKNSTLRHNLAEFGGGIYNVGTLTVTDTAITDSTNGILNAGGTMTLHGITVSGNGGNGLDTSDGGITNGGTATITDSVVSNNTSTAAGGIGSYGLMTLKDVVVTGNRSVYGVGGGIRNGGTLTIQNGTITDNSSVGPDPSTGVGGGINNDTGGELTLRDSTVSGNFAGLLGGGIYNSGLLTLSDNTITGNTPDDCFGC
jgi:hypothetical protein